jgi:hypothetical protein
MPGAHDHSVGRVPFWLHQLVELLLGILLLVEGARTGQHTVVLVSLGGVLLLLALCSDGALGAWTWIGRRVHRVLDLVVAAVLAVSPLLFGLDHVLAIVILEVAAAAMLWLALRTEWRRREKPTPAAPPPAPAAAPKPPAATPTATPAATPAATPTAPLARKLGGAVGKARDDGPRQLGRLVGRAQRAAKAAMTPESPPSPPSTPPATPAEPPVGPSGAPDRPNPA